MTDKKRHAISWRFDITFTDIDHNMPHAGIRQIPITIQNVNAEIMITRENRYRKM
jgi:hypothetical protein